MKLKREINFVHFQYAFCSSAANNVYLNQAILQEFQVYVWEDIERRLNVPLTMLQLGKIN